MSSITWRSPTIFLPINPTLTTLRHIYQSLYLGLCRSSSTKMVAMNTKLPRIVLLFSLMALSACLALSPSQETEVDPELITCKHQCRQQLQYSQRAKQKCMDRCDSYHQKKKEEHERQIEEEVRKRKEEGCDEEGKENWFVFGDEQFKTRVQTDDGKVRVLQKFTAKSNLLRGIENFRVAILEAQQHSFVSPLHFDSELIIFTVKGRASVGLVKGDKTEKFNLETGDIIRIPSGTPFYIVNRDENEKLILAKLHITVSIPGHFEAFYGPGGRDPESVLEAFSWDVLQASIKAHKESLKWLFGRQKRGSIFRISKDEVKSLSKGWELPSLWPFGGPDRSPFNLFKSKFKSSVSNEYGQLYQAGPEDQGSLDDLNLMIDFTDITNGSMSAPLYNTKAIKIGVVTNGTGRFEMVTPHHSEKGHRKSSPIYERVSGELRPGVVFVVPAGHPWVTRAYKQSNLQIVCFEVNARGNVKLALAGKRNIVKAMDKKAKELAFNWPAEKVDDIFSRKEEFFFPGPHNLEEDENEEYEELPHRAEA